MSGHFAMFFVTPLIVATITILAMAWLHILNEYGIWQRFVRHKTRMRPVYAVIIAWLIYVAFDAAAYRLGKYATIPDEPTQATLGVVWICSLFAVVITPSLYALADAMLQKCVKIGERRTGIRDHGVGIYAKYHAGWGGEHHI